MAIAYRSISDLTRENLQQQLANSTLSQQAMAQLQNATQGPSGMAGYSQAQQNYILEGNLISHAPHRHGIIGESYKPKPIKDKAPFDLRRFIDKLISLPISLIDRMATVV